MPTPEDRNASAAAFVQAMRDNAAAVKNLAKLVHEQNSLLVELIRIQRAQVGAGSLAGAAAIVAKAIKRRL